MHEVVRRHPYCIPPNTILVFSSSPFFCRHALGSHRLFGVDCCCSCCFCCCLYHGNSLTIRNSHAFADGRPIIFASCRDVEFRRRACSPRKDRPICLGEEFGLESLDQGQGDDSHCAEPGLHPSKQSELAVLIGLNLSHIATSLPVVIRRC